MAQSGTSNAPRETYVTSVHSTEYSYTWIIRNFEAWHKKQGGPQDSPQFPSGLHEQVKWILTVGPLAKADELFLSLHLELVSSDLAQGKLEATCEITVTTTNGFNSVMGPYKYNFPLNENWGWDRLLKKDNLLKNAKPTDELIIKCKITANERLVNETLNNQFEPLPSSLSKDLKTLVGVDSKFGDVTILVAGQRFPAHKCILSARSSVFSAMFEHPMQETIENCVSIDDIEPPVFEALLRFIYTDELTSLETLAHALYKAADKYDVPTLKSHCRCHILEKLSWETAAETLMLADLCSDLEMKKHVLQFLSGSVAAKVTETDGWKEMARACPHLVDETIRAMASQLMSRRERKAFRK
uniref:Speckle-type POZ protein n=1 Tax=Culex pipiens TaxID=7175 RepID=A0A8D8G8G5_CULPI